MLVQQLHLRLRAKGYQKWGKYKKLKRIQTKHVKVATLDSIRCQQLKINTPGFSTSKGSVPGIEKVFRNLKHGVVAENLGTLYESKTS